MDPAQDFKTSIITMDRLTRSLRTSTEMLAMTEELSELSAAEVFASEETELKEQSFVSLTKFFAP